MAVHGSSVVPAKVYQHKHMLYLTVGLQVDVCTPCVTILRAQTRCRSVVLHACLRVLVLPTGTVFLWCERTGAWCSIN